MDPETNSWAYDLITDTILHNVDKCSICSGYFSHFHKALRQKSPSMEDALDKCTLLTVSIQEHKKLFTKYKECTEDRQEMLDEIKCLKAKSDAQQCQIEELTMRHEKMLHDQINLSASFKRKKTTTEQVFEPACCPHLQFHLWKSFSAGEGKAGNQS